LKNCAVAQRDIQMRMVEWFNQKSALGLSRVLSGRSHAAGAAGHMVMLFGGVSGTPAAGGERPGIAF